MAWRLRVVSNVERKAVYCLSFEGFVGVEKTLSLGIN